MATVNKIDSNVTGLRIAEEASIKTLPTTPIWVPVEPNSYSDFGGQIDTKSRSPISDTRQLLKGGTTDLDASGGISLDLTQETVPDLLQGFMFADYRRKGEGLVSAVDTGADTWSIPSSTGWYVGSILWSVNHGDAGNNGRFIVSAVTPAVLATETLTVAAGNASDGDIMTLGTRPYTFKTALSTSPIVADEILIGANAAATVVNIVAAILAGASSGTLFSSLTTINLDVTAVDGVGDTVDFTATAPLQSGLAGNAVALAEDGSDLSFGGGAVFLTGGVDALIATASNLVTDASPAATAEIVVVGFQFAADDLDAVTGGAVFPTYTTSTKDMTELGLVPGEKIFLSGDTAITQYTNAANNGWKTVRSAAANVLTISKSVLDVITETLAGSETIEMYFGRVLRNESAALITRRTYQLERTLGAVDDAFPLNVQSEYLTGAVPNELVLNVPQADFFTADLGYIGLDNEQRTGTVGVKSGTRPAAPVDAAAFNTSSDFSLIKMAIASATDESPDALFAFVTDLNITVNNNITPNKAIGVLGGFDASAGNFTVSGSVTAYFADVASVSAVRDNSDVSLDFIIVRSNAGMSFELPLVGLGDGRLNVEQDQSITIPLSLNAASARTLASTLDYTFQMSFFDYLPDAADTAA